MINTRSLSIVIDKPIPLSIGIPIPPSLRIFPVSGNQKGLIGLRSGKRRRRRKRRILRAEILATSPGRLCVASGAMVDFVNRLLFATFVVSTTFSWSFQYCLPPRGVASRNLEVCVGLVNGLFNAAKVSILFADSARHILDECSLC